ncbi:MAG: hypothetical protein EOO80_16285 [Oxalobacteraceae bacterium]|nr:MAG: hypothetical protein EOO80_16285 [Oxalobacteraceae bacterium]
MAVYRRVADWSVGYWSSLQMDPRIADYTGWVFAAKLGRAVGDPAAIALGVAGTLEGEGFFVANGPARVVSLRILPATLQAYPDSSGRFELFANVLATPPGKARFKAFDLVLTVNRGTTP